MKRGFTSAEWLVVAVLAVVLAALLLPGLDQARARAHAVTCRDNLRQVYLGLMLYADDWDGWGLPGIRPTDGYTRVPVHDRGGWVRAYFPGAMPFGTDNIFHCPSDPAGSKGWAPGRSLLQSSYRLLFGTGNYIYGRRGHARNNFHGWRRLSTSSAHRYPGWPSRAFPLANRCFAGRTITYENPGTGGRRSFAYDLPPGEQPLATDLYNPRRRRVAGAHSSARTRVMHRGLGGMNVLMLDGSVHWRTDREIGERYRNHAGDSRAAWW